MSLVDKIKELFRGNHDQPVYEGDRRFLSKMAYSASVLAGLGLAINLMACTDDKDLPNIDNHDNPKAILSSTNAAQPAENTIKELLKNLGEFTDPASAYHLHDALIIKYTDFWNNYFGKMFAATTFQGTNLGYKFEPLDPLRIKAMIMQESGSPTDRNTAYRYDPMQIANEGDYALAAFRDGPKNNGDWLVKRLREDPDLKIAQELANIKNTPRNNGEWDYNAVPDTQRITAELSIKYGIAWLWTRKIMIGEVKEGATIVSYAICNTRLWDDASMRYKGGSEKYKDNVWRLMHDRRTK